MLALSLQEGLGVTIGDNIRVTVIRLNKDKVVVGFNAPRDQVILRVDERGNVLTGRKKDKKDGTKQR